jgi:transposase
MEMVGGLDIHRRQFTFEFADHDSGELWRGRLWKPDRARVCRWLGEDVAARAKGRPVRLAVEGCTGWRFAVEEICAAGFTAYVAEPAELQGLRKKRRAKTDRSDARLLRTALEDGRLPLSWIPPTIVLEWRERARLYRTLLDQRTSWQQRIHAELFQHGVAVPEAAIVDPQTRASLLAGDSGLSEAARLRVRVAYQQIDAANAALEPLRGELVGFGRRQKACKQLQQLWGVGPLVAVAAWSELGDCRRFTRSDQAVRHSGLDVTVHSSDLSRAGGHLSRQGAPLLRWALFEAGKAGARKGSPDRDYYQQVKARQGGKRATMSVGRKIAKRCFHVLRGLDLVDVYHDPTAA